jgi:hypothetical protein
MHFWLLQINQSYDRSSNSQPSHTPTRKSAIRMSAHTLSAGLVLLDVDTWHDRHCGLHEVGFVLGLCLFLQ